MTSTKRINHVALVVDDIDDALEFWRDGLGLKVSYVEDVPEQGVVVAFLSTQEQEVELVKPTDSESGIAHFLKERGPGMHHLCLEVVDLAGCLEHLKSLDIKLINDEPVVGTGGKLIAFIHPQSTHGVLVELYELTEEESEIRLALAGELADRVMMQGQIVAAGVLGFLRGLRQDGKRERVDDEPS